MATISFTIPDNDLSRVIEALCYNNGYTDTMPNGNANPIGKNAFAKKVLIAKIKADIAEYEAHIAVKTARDDALVKAHAININ